jgi:hypothetical protein
MGCETNDGINNSILLPQQQLMGYRADPAGMKLPESIWIKDLTVNAYRATDRP